MYYQRVGAPSFAHFAKGGYGNAGSSEAYAACPRNEIQTQTLNPNPQTPNPNPKPKPQTPKPGDRRDVPQFLSKRLSNRG